MAIFLFTVGVLKTLAAVWFMVSAATVMHELVAVTAFGFAIVAFALGAVIERLDRRP